ncbi:MAG: hypothetical protein E7K64_00765 [Clostridia bacterium]|nr:hypothetical protein [Clostridiales bacterium]MDU7433689.1 hypothetical protein [Anaerococcus vaginalis]MDU7504563.1 hypothetical protein [Clostridia bacterium]
MAKEYDLARRMASLGPRSYPVEVGAIVGVTPLVVQIGSAQYDSTYWNFWQMYQEDKAIKMEEVKLKGTDSLGGTVHIEPVLLANKSKSEMELKVGDRIAVQQMRDDKSFIILAKVRRV